MQIEQLNEMNQSNQTLIDDLRNEKQQVEIEVKEIKAELGKIKQAL